MVHWEQNDATELDFSTPAKRPSYVCSNKIILEKEVIVSLTLDLRIEYRWSLYRLQFIDRDCCTSPNATIILNCCFYNTFSISIAFICLDMLIYWYESRTTSLSADINCVFPPFALLNERVPRLIDHLIDCFCQTTDHLTRSKACSCIGSFYQDPSRAHAVEGGSPIIW